MTDQTVKFVAADMDGTLLDEHSQLDPVFFDIFEQLEKNNIVFSAASGRQYYSLLQTFEPIQERMMFIAENGTLVMYQGQELYSCSIDTPSMHECIRQARTIDGASLVLCGKKSAYIETQDADALKEIGKYYHRCEYVDDLLSVDDEFIKLAICHFGGVEQQLYPLMNEKFGDSHQVVVSARIWLDIMNAKASKGAALRFLQQHLGFTYNQTMCFGDYLNDLEMLEESYHSYAMANAHDQVKQTARLSAPSNADRGVFVVLKQYLASLENLETK